MTRPGIYNSFVIYKGATFTESMQWKPSINGNPYDLTGYTAACTIRGFNGTSQVVTCSISTTTLTISLTAAQTALMTEGGSYSLVLTRPDATVFAFLEGYIRLDENA